MDNYKTSERLNEDSYAVFAFCSRYSLVYLSFIFIVFTIDSAELGFITHGGTPRIASLHSELFLFIKFLLDLCYPVIMVVGVVSLLATRRKNYLLILNFILTTSLFLIFYFVFKDMFLWYSD